MLKFDPHVIIKRLAEAEWGCLHGLKDEHGNPVVLCARCLGTGRIVPFASLRMECPLLAQEKKVWPLQEGEFIELHACIVCDSRRWIPEPDVRVACWEIAKVRANAVRSESEAQHLVDNMAEDSLLLDTEVWVKEQEVTNGRVSVIEGA